MPETPPKPTLEYARPPQTSPFERMPRWLQRMTILTFGVTMVIVALLGIWAFWFLGSLAWSIFHGGQVPN